MPDGNQADRPDWQEPLERWLSGRVHGGGEVSIGEVDRPHGGFSAETVLFTAFHGGTAHRYVLRRENPDPAMYPRQVPGMDVEVDIQYRVMRALRSAGVVPLAGVVGYEEDPAVLGSPFFVMDFVPGDVPRESPLYTRSGFFVGATPEQRRTLVEDGLRVLAAVHALDWQAAGLGWLAPGPGEPDTARQVGLWRAYADREVAGRYHPVLDAGFAWLDRHPPAPAKPGFCWGDSRPGNMIWQDFRCACVTDFEAACIAPPEVDLGWWLMFDRWVHEAQGVERLPGEPTRHEQRGVYRAAGGAASCDPADLDFYEVFAAVRYTAIVVRAMNRMGERGIMPSDQIFWRDNPSTTCLEQMLAEF